MENTPEEFAHWFRVNYPGPRTIISDPDWHAPKIYRAAIRAASGDDCLLVAAPELLAACKIAQERFRQMGMDWLGKGPGPLEAAIAKAEGKVPTA